MDLPFALETPLEELIAADPDWQTGIEWGEPRDGHPEGAVKWHVAEVLANIGRLELTSDERRRLRLAAIVHDTFKYQVDRSRPRIPPNEHGALASRFLARYVDHKPLLALVELHDDGYRAWVASGAGNDEESRRRLSHIVVSLGEDVGTFLRFYWADNGSGEKDPSQLEWFVDRLRLLGVSLSLPQPVPETR